MKLVEVNKLPDLKLERHVYQMMRRRLYWVTIVLPIGVAIDPYSWHTSGSPLK